MTTTQHSPKPYLDETADIAAAWDASRPRSLQAELGVSELMGCRSAIGFRLMGAWESDVTDTWRAIVGTAMHDWLTETRKAALPHLLFDVDTTYRGTPGHPDEVDPKANRVAEWKFPRLSTSLLWQGDDEAFLPKRAQAHAYAAGLIEAGVLPEEDCTVVVAVMPVDGSYADWWTHEEPFDRRLADLGPNRRDEVQGMIDRDEPLPRDKPFAWCEEYCEFFTMCRGRGKAPESEPITDPESAAAVRMYGELLDEIRPLERRKKELAKEIRGMRGMVGDPAEGVAWRVTMTEPSGSKTVTDFDAVEQQYAERGEALPTKTVPTSSPSLRVTAVKPPKTKTTKTKGKA